MRRLYGPGTSVACPKCGARGAEQCTTQSGRDHLARQRAEIETLPLVETGGEGR